VKKGDTPFHKMMAETDRGLWVKDLMGLHMADTVTGDFSLGASGKLIEKGEATSGVRGIMIAGNIFDLLKDVETIGNDFTVYGDVGAPSLKIKSLKISGK
jgi:PmbA protein